MANRSARFGVGNPDGMRSSEWVIMWKSNTADVFIGTRGLAGSFKASLHESGQCHIRAPDPRYWGSDSPAPAFLDKWKIDPHSNYVQAFGVIIPHSELRAGDWSLHRDKPTIWIPVLEGAAVEIAVFLIRAIGDLTNSLRAAGWHTTVVDQQLVDGRRLIVAAGHAVVPPERQSELQQIRRRIQADLAASGQSLENGRFLLNATDQAGARRFVEAALSDVTRRDVPSADAGQERPVSGATAPSRLQRESVMPKIDKQTLWTAVGRSALFIVRCWVFSILFCAVFFQFWHRNMLASGNAVSAAQQAQYAELVRRSTDVLKRQEENAALEARLLEQREARSGTPR